MPKKPSESVRQGAVTVTRSEGSAAATLRVDARLLERPALAGFADTCGFKTHFDFFELEFLTSDGNESGVVLARVVISFETLVNSLWPTCVRFYDSLSPRSSELGADHYRLSGKLRGTTAAVRADVILMARNATSAEVEFHTLNMYSTHLATTMGTKIQVAPLFTVQLPIGLLTSVLTYLKELYDSNRGRIKQDSGAAI